MHSMNVMAVQQPGNGHVSKRRERPTMLGNYALALVASRTKGGTKAQFANIGTETREKRLKAFSIGHLSSSSTKKSVWPKIFFTNRFCF